MTASSRGLKLCAKSNDVCLLSYKDLHKMAGRATPNRLAKYKLALQLYKTLTQKCPTNDWISINFNIINISRQKMFAVNKTNRLRVGYNALSNRLNFINGKIDLDWLNLSFNTYKIKCKWLFLWNRSVSNWCRNWKYREKFLLSNHEQINKHDYAGWH